MDIMRRYICGRNLTIWYQYGMAIIYTENDIYDVCRWSFEAWFALLSMLIYRAAFSLSLGPLPYVMTSEFFSQEARAAGADH